jgi:lipopolysaccharide transport system ATP-binding protein
VEPRAIRADQLSKRYDLQGSQPTGSSFREAISRKLKLWKDALSGVRSEPSLTFWALRDASFEIARGEVVGLIGANGSGKSTLLKILSWITDPSSGRAEIHGRVSPILEVGMGFHPELTGRENLYLNAAILGMRRVDARRKFDDIIQFAGIARFVDIPIKRFSSGMQARLGFSIAAHLDSDILIIDEVLAVGDAAFQERCLERIGSLSREGRTIIFVSHDMNAVARLCDRVIYLRGGAIEFDGPPIDAISRYLGVDAHSTTEWNATVQSDREPAARIVHVRARRVDANHSLPFRFDHGIAIDLRITVSRTLDHPVIALRLTNSWGTVAFTSWHTDTATAASGENLSPGSYRACCLVPPCLLPPEQYAVSVALLRPHAAPYDSLDRVVSFEVATVGFPLNAERIGVVAPLLPWTLERESS